MIAASGGPQQANATSLDFSSVHSTHHATSLDVQERRSRSGQAEDRDVISQSVETSPDIPCPKWMEMHLTVCRPILCVWGFKSLQACASWVNSIIQDKNPPESPRTRLSLNIATLVFPTTQTAHEEAISGEESHVHHDSRQMADDVVIEGMENKRSTLVQKWVEMLLWVCCPIACFWALNLAGAANTSTQSVTSRVYVMKLAALPLESSAHRVSALTMTGVGCRTK
jgi:hypothetical protein